jgi:hypothetical protein
MWGYWKFSKAEKNMMFVDPCIVVLFIKKIQQDATMYKDVLLFHIYMKLNMFRATHRPSSGA